MRRVTRHEALHSRMQLLPLAGTLLSSNTRMRVNPACTIAISQETSACLCQSMQAPEPSTSAAPSRSLSVLTHLSAAPPLQPLLGCHTWVGGAGACCLAPPLQTATAAARQQTAACAAVVWRAAWRLQQQRQPPPQLPPVQSHRQQQPARLLQRCCVLAAEGGRRRPHRLACLTERQWSLQDTTRRAHIDVPAVLPKGRTTPSFNNV